MGRYQMRSVALRGSLRRSTIEHKAILRAVREGDAEKAVRLLGEHIRIPQRRIEDAPDQEVVVRDAI
jgi:DNA-binding GntR family transcriptional regulator